MFFLKSHKYVPCKIFSGNILHGTYSTLRYIQAAIHFKLGEKMTNELLNYDENVAKEKARLTVVFGKRYHWKLKALADCHKSVMAEMGGKIIEEYIKQNEHLIK